MEAGAPSGYAPVAAPARRSLAVVAALGVAVLSLLAGGAYWLVGGTGAHVGAAHAAALPRTGVLVHGESLAGVELGDSEAEVRALWGRHFTVCSGCDGTTWFYIYPTGDPFGAAVKFRDGRVTAVFTLGAPTGWRDDEGTARRRGARPAGGHRGRRDLARLHGLRREVNAGRRGGLVRPTCRASASTASR